jgi:hypothetical protein
MLGSYSFIARAIREQVIPWNVAVSLGRTGSRLALASASAAPGVAIRGFVGRQTPVRPGLRVAAREPRERQFRSGLETPPTWEGNPFPSHGLLLGALGRDHRRSGNGASRGP